MALPTRLMRLTTVRRRVAPYFTAVVTVAAAVVVKFWVAPLLGADAPFLLFHAAVLFSAWRGGVGPGLLATGLAALAADYFVVPAVGRLILRDDPLHALRLLLFVAEGAFISALSGLRLRSSMLAYRRADELLQAIRVVAAGETYLDPALTEHLVAGYLGGEPRADGSAQPLSGREAEVLRLIAVGYVNKEVAARLGVSVKTVVTYKLRAMDKLGSHGRVDVVRHAYRQGWLDEARG